MNFDWQETIHRPWAQRYANKGIGSRIWKILHKEFEFPGAKWRSRVGHPLTSKESAFLQIPERAPYPTAFVSLRSSDVSLAKKAVQSLLASGLDYVSRLIETHIHEPRTLAADRRHINCCPYRR